MFDTVGVNDSDVSIDEPAEPKLWVASLPTPAKKGQPCSSWNSKVSLLDVAVSSKRNFDAEERISSPLARHTLKWRTALRQNLEDRVFSPDPCASAHVDCGPIGETSAEITICDLITAYYLRRLNVDIVKEGIRSTAVLGCCAYSQFYSLTGES